MIICTSKIPSAKELLFFLDSSLAANIKIFSVSMLSPLGAFEKRSYVQRGGCRRIFSAGFVRISENLGMWQMSISERPSKVVLADGGSMAPRALCQHLETFLVVVPGEALSSTWHFVGGGGMLLTVL